ncbi:Cysteinyl-tRNA synthetase [Hordeum vulgare]|nr:Cysteinyl-tRNA synthetase [Hordeum vulgare]
MKVADLEEDEAEQIAPRFNMTETEAEFAIVQDEEMSEQQAILESIQDEADVEDSRQFLSQKIALLDVNKS